MRVSPQPHRVERESLSLILTFRIACGLTSEVDQHNDNETCSGICKEIGIRAATIVHAYVHPLGKPSQQNKDDATADHADTHTFWLHGAAEKYDYDDQRDGEHSVIVLVSGEAA